MKFCIALINILICCGLIMAADRCPSICPAVYSPVCGEAQVRGRPMQCTFSNSCQLGVNACTKGINWRQVSSGECKRSSPGCSL